MTACFVSGCDKSHSLLCMTNKLPIISIQTIQLLTVSGTSHYQTNAFLLLLFFTWWIVVEAACNLTPHLFSSPSRIHLSNDSTPWGKRMLLHLTFISPLFPIFLWVDPVIRHLVDFLSACQHNPLVAQQPLLLIALNLVCECLGQYLGTTRLFACLFVVILRCLTTRCNLQVCRTRWRGVF